MKDDYCYCGNKWTEVFNTTLFSDCYYCHTCDKIYEMKAVEVTKDDFKRAFNCDRFNEIKNYAKIVEAKKNITNDDLKRLGYLYT